MTGNTSVHRLLNADLASRWATLAIGAWVAWHTRDLGLAATWAWPGTLVAYGLVVALNTAALRALQSDGAWPNAARYALLAGDALCAAALTWRDGGLSSPLYLLIFLLALKAAAWAPQLPRAPWAAFALGPLYAATLALAAGNLAFLADGSFLARYLLLWAWLAGVALLGLGLARRAAQAASLDAALSQQQAALAQKTEVLQRTATDLGDRVLELRSLQEVAKALASTLSLEDTLRLVAERLRDATGSRHAAVALVDAGGFAPDAGDELEGVVAAEAQSDEPHAFRLPLSAEALVAEALRSGRTARAGGGAELPPTPLGQLLGGGEYMITPLVSRGRPIGALFLAGGPETRADAKAEQLAASLAYFAATAIENARLYSDAWEKRRELEAVLAGIGDGVVVVDPGLRLILMNPVAQRILGLADEPPAGAPLHATLAEHIPAAGSGKNAGEDGSGQAFAGLLEETLRGGHELIRELALPVGPGSERAATGRVMRTYGALASPVLDADGEVSGVVAVLRDITTQKELERMKSNFLSVVSHELRTPLHSIKGFVEIILMGKTGPVTELQEDFLRTVRTQTTALQRMIDDLLEFSRMEAGRVRLHVAEMALPAMLRAVAAKLAPLAEEANLELYLDLPDDLPEIEGDRMRLEQVFTNLVENAIKFTPAGGRIVVSATAPADHVRITVTDSGIGIPPAEQERIFDRFYQVDGSERRAYRGAGLGLSICRHIVERHSGRIWVESEGTVGKGTRFHVELPQELHLAEAPTIDFTTPAG